MSQKSFSHMVPLLLFTTMIIISAGLITGLALVQLSDNQWQTHALYLYVSVVLAALGSLISFLHLGRKKKAALSLAGLSHSWLSREAVGAAVFTGFGGAALAMVLFSFENPALLKSMLYASTASGIVTVLAIGFLYNYKVQLSWSGLPNVAAPLISCMLIAIGLALFTADLLQYELWFFALWTVDVLLVALRLAGLRDKLRARHSIVFKGMAGWSLIGLVIRALISLVVMTLICINMGDYVLFLILVNVVLDRWTFYTGTVKSTPASEIGAIKEQRMYNASAD